MTHRRSLRRQVNTVLIYIAVAAVLVWVLFPIVWVILGSLKGREEASAIPPVWIFRPSIENYVSAFVRRNFSMLFVNSLVATLGSTVVVVVLGSMAGYGLARFRIMGKQGILVWIMSTRMFPPIAAIIPIFLLFKNLDLIDTRQGLVLIYIAFNLPFAIWIMTGFFAEIPSELDDAALVDGCTPWQAFTKVILPLSLPGLAATAIFCMIFSWNEFLFALIISRSHSQTLPIGVMGFITQRGVLWGEMSAASTVIMMPMIVFIFFVQRYLIRGLSFGAVKG
jgi:multiple sugar transport system permease protein